MYNLFRILSLRKAYLSSANASHASLHFHSHVYLRIQDCKHASLALLFRHDDSEYRQQHNAVPLGCGQIHQASSLLPSLILRRLCGYTTNAIYHALCTHDQTIQEKKIFLLTYYLLQHRLELSNDISLIQSHLD